MSTSRLPLWMLIWKSLDKEFWQLFVGRAWDLWQWAWWNRGLKKRGACRRAQASMFMKESCVALMSGFLNESMTAVRKIYGKELGIWYSDTVAMFKCFLKLQPSLYLIKCKFGTPLLRIADHGVTICNNNVSIGVSLFLSTMVKFASLIFSHEAWIEGFTIFMAWPTVMAWLLLLTTRDWIKSPRVSPRRFIVSNILMMMQPLLFTSCMNKFKTRSITKGFNSDLQPAVWS